MKSPPKVGLRALLRGLGEITTWEATSKSWLLANEALTHPPKALLSLIVGPHWKIEKEYQLHPVD